MIKKIAEGNIYFWLIFHVLLGALSTFSSIFVIAWAYLLIGNVLYVLFTNKKEFEIINYFFCYWAAFEVLTRMTKSYPYIPTESGKYFTVFFLLMAFLNKAQNTNEFKVNRIGLLIILFSLPSILLIKYGNFWNCFAFNALGIICLGLFVIYYSNFVFKRDELLKMFKMMVLPVLSIAVNTLIKSPKLSEITFDLTANFESTGGYGPNQVAATYGVGILAIGIPIILNIKLLKQKWIEILLLLLFLFRCFLTLSRGGLISGLLGILPALLFGTITKSAREKAVKFSYFLVFLGCAGLMFYYVDNVTGSTLTARFKGETFATRSGERDISIETISDNRSVIIGQEMDMFRDHPILGVGPGQTSYIINKDYLHDSHTEFTRLLAENGIFGLVIDLMLLFPLLRLLFLRRFFMKEGFSYFINIGFLIFALSMCAHSGMRTLCTPLFFGLGFAGYMLGSDDVEKELV